MLWNIGVPDEDLTTRFADNRSVKSSYGAIANTMQDCIGDICDLEDTKLHQALEVISIWIKFWSICSFERPSRTVYAYTDPALTAERDQRNQLQWAYRS